MVVSARSTTTLLKSTESSENNFADSRFLDSRLTHFSHLPSRFSLRIAMPIQAPQWTDFLACPVCYNGFDAKARHPISLGCAHTVCKSCLSNLPKKQCPFDQVSYTFVGDIIGYLCLESLLVITILCILSICVPKPQF